MVGEQRNHVATFAKHFFGKSLQRLLRSDFDKDARARVVKRLQALHKLHRRRNLLREQVQHLRNNIRPRGIKLAIHVGNDRYARRLQVQVRQHLAQRLAGRSDDRRVEMRG